jgi:hypothetical protein
MLQITWRDIITMQKKSDIFEVPEEFEEDELRNISVASHMSFLTNKRMHELLIMRDMAGVEAGSTFALMSIISYGSTLEAIYKEIESIIDDTQREEVQEIFQKYYSILYASNPDPNAENVIGIQKRVMMYNYLSVIHRLMNSYLQNPYQYFFRIESKPMKGIRNTLKRMGWLDDPNLQGMVKE